MPAKSVVFSGIRKHDGTGFRNLLPGEYTQMAGRAGRRGLDTTGTVIILSAGDELLPAKELQDMMLGTPNRLSSQFRLTYNMILNLLRVEALKVEEMIKRSFSENAAQKLAPEQQKEVEKTEKLLAKMPELDCSVCSSDIGAFYDLSAEIVRLNGQLMSQMSWAPGKQMIPGRIILLRDGHFPGNVAVVLRNAPSIVRSGVKSDAKAFYVLALVTKEQKSKRSDIQNGQIPPRWPPVLPEGKFNEPQWELCTVDAASISFVTTKMLKLNITAILDQRNRDVTFKTMEELVQIHEELSEGGDLEEFDWSRLSKLEFQETLRQRIALTDRLSKLGCVLCDHFDEHYEVIHERKKIENSLKALKLSLSDQNLELLPDYNSRVEVLKELNFIDEFSTVLLKGRVACEINSAHELILTEVILDNILVDYTPQEAVALLSVFVSVEKSDSKPEIPAKLAQGLDTIYAIADNVENCQLRKHVAFEDFREKFKPSLVEVVYEWAKGTSFSEITQLTDIPEGTIVRVITRLDETCREVRDAARVIGDADLFTKMEEAQALIKRDIVFAASLYL